MGRSVTKTIFFLNLSILGGILAFAIYQVPQPWRGALVVFLLLSVSVGWLVTGLVRHYYRYKTETAKRPRRPKPEPKNRKPSIRVVRTHSKGARHVIR